MTRLNLTLQGKGGVGKSVVATFLAQHRQEREYELICLDTDPINATFSQFDGLQVKRLNIMDGLTIKARAFDDIVEETLRAPEHAELVVDCGATSFVALSGYLIENNIGEYLAEHGHELVIHVVLVGGQAALDSLNGLNAIASQIPEPTRLVVWFNEFFGDTVIESDGEHVQLMDTAAFQNAENRIDGTITLWRGSDLEREDVQALLQGGQTFAEGLLDETHSVMSRSRMKKLRDRLWEQLDVVLGKPTAVTPEND